MKIILTDKGAIILNENNVLYARIIESGDKFKITLETDVGNIQPVDAFETKDDTVKWLLENIPNLVRTTDEYFLNLQKIVIAEPHYIDGKLISYTVHFSTKKLPISASWLLPEFVENFPELKELM